MYIRIMPAREKHYDGFKFAILADQFSTDHQEAIGVMTHPGSYGNIQLGLSKLKQCMMFSPLSTSGKALLPNIGRSLSACGSSAIDGAPLALRAPTRSMAY